MSEANPRVDIQPVDREVRYRSSLVKLSNAVLVFLAEADKILTNPVGEEKGRAMARLSNALEFVNDSVRYSVLKVDFRTDKKEPLK